MAAKNDYVDYLAYKAITDIKTAMGTFSKVGPFSYDKCVCMCGWIDDGNFNYITTDRGATFETTTSVTSLLVEDGVIEVTGTYIVTNTGTTTFEIYDLRTFLTASRASQPNKGLCVVEVTKLPEGCIVAPGDRVQLNYTVGIRYKESTATTAEATT